MFPYVGLARDVVSVSFGGNLLTLKTYSSFFFFYMNVLYNVIKQVLWRFKHTLYRL